MRIEFVVRHKEDKTVEESFDSPSDVTKHLEKVNGNTEQWLITVDVVINEMASVMLHEDDWPDQPGGIICAHTGKQWFSEKLERYWSNKYQHGADNQ